MPDIFADPNTEILPTQKPTTQNTPVPPQKSSVSQNPRRLKGTAGPFSSFAWFPDGVHFDAQIENEEIQLFLRRAFITNVPWIVVSLILIALPTILFPVITPILSVAARLSPLLPTILFAFYYLIVFGFILSNYLLWYFNIYIVTNFRIIDIDLYNILNKDVATAYLTAIRDISVNTRGFFGTIFDYGDILMQTEATIENLTFEAVPHPQLVMDEIQRLVDAATGGHTG